MQERTGGKKGWGRYLVLTLLVVLGVGIVGAFVFWQKEITVYWRFKPWQRADYQGLLDRFHQAAAASDEGAVQAYVDGSSVRVKKGKGEPAIQYGQAQKTKTISMQDLASRGPFPIESIELEYAGDGAALIHAVDKAGKPLLVVVQRGPKNNRVIAGLDFPIAAPGRPRKRSPSPATSS